MKSNNQINVPQAREAMDKFKMLIRFRGRCQSDQRLQRSPDLPRGRLRGRPDGQEHVSHTKRKIRPKQQNFSWT